jgi:hypothetical protein
MLNNFNMRACRNGLKIIGHENPDNNLESPYISAGQAVA